MSAVLSAPAATGTERTMTQPSDKELLARYVSSGDESAFALLIQRHGPMVLGACRRILGNHHDAEDAFQATFTLLARRAGSLSRPDRLAGWLYGVAQRTALKLRSLRASREEAERQAPPAVPPAPELECAWREVQQALDEEIGRLDPPLRNVIVLCYLEGKTHEAAAYELGRPLGSMSWLLSRALQTLRERLTRRGMKLTGGMSSLLLALQGPFPVSEELLLATLRVVGVVGTASPLAFLIEAVLRELKAERSMRLVRGVLMAFLLVLGVGTAGYQAIAAGAGHASGGGTGAEQHGSASGCCHQPEK